MTAGRPWFDAVRLVAARASAILWSAPLRYLNLALAMVLSLTLKWWPLLATGEGGKLSHGLVSLMLLFVCAGYIHGVGFRPYFWLWRYLFSPLWSLPANTFAMLAIASKWLA